MTRRAARFPLGRHVTIEALADDPYPLFHELRASEPVTWAPELGMWLLTRRDDIVRVLADWERFTTDAAGSTIRDIFGSNMLTTDGEEQIRYKRRFIGPFRRGRLEENLLGTVRGVLQDLMHELESDSVLISTEVTDARSPDHRAEARSSDHRADVELAGTRTTAGPGAVVGRADLRARIARPLSVRSICRVLGLPEEDGPRLLRWYDRFAAALENFAGDPAVRAAGRRAAREFSEYALPFIRGERAAPEGSMIRALGGDAEPGRTGPGDMRDRGDSLSETETIANLLLVLFGGIETTESMIGNAFWAVLSHPEVAARVASECAGARTARSARPAATAAPLLRAVIEESMRWEPAVQSCMRFATADVRIRGVPIARGETVHCLVGAANRDPGHFPDPDRFDPDRPNARDHLAFGAGRHFCLGASLARIEAEQALLSVFGGLPGLRLDAARPSRPRGHEFRAPPTVWVQWGAAPST